MVRNVGSLDQFVRLLIGLAMLSLIFVGPKTYWGLLGIVPLLTAAVGFCPLYRILGLSTCRNPGAKA